MNTALITGGSRGIGRSIALHFAQSAYDIAICARSDSEGLQHTQDLIHTQTGGRCHTYLADVSSYDDCKAMFAQIKDDLGDISVLVNNAGISYMGLLQDMSPADWHTVLETNLTSCFNCCQLAIPDMVRAHHGHIINISSIWGQHGSSCEVAYSASKGGMDAFTKALAQELAPSGILVNAISCGLIDTAMNENLTKDELADVIADIPLGRIGTPDDIATVAVFLATQNYITGQVLGVDGGWMA